MASSRDFHDYPSSMFHPETIAIPVVTRARLLSRIMGSDARKVTLVAAPLGYGKTVLLTQVYDAQREEGRRCIWLSINEEFDNSTLLEILWAAADHAGIPASTSVAVTVNSLLKRIENCAEPVSIMIDNLNRDMLDNADLTLSHLIRGAPQGTSFLIATDTAPPLPVLRLQASGLLHKIAAADLAFDDADIDALGEMTTLPDWISIFNERVEGWPVIVQLALSRFQDESEPLPRLTGCQYDVAAFLEQDVLRNVPPEEFARLLDASIVDQICGFLLDALSGGNDGSDILGKFVARGIPIYGLRNREWFRLHPLLRDYLYDWLQRRDADRLTLLHQRAATWLLSSGDEQAALCHATASGNIDFLRAIYQCLNVPQALLPDHNLQPIVTYKPVNPFSGTTSKPIWPMIFNLIQTGQINQARDALADARQQTPIFIAADLSDVYPVEWELTYIDLLMRAFDDRLPRPDQLEALRNRLMRMPGVPPSISAGVSELVIVSRFRRGDLSGMAEADHDLWHTNALAPTQSKIYVLLELGIAALELGELDLASRHLKNASTRALQAYGPHSPHAYAASTFLAELAFERGDREASMQLLEQSFPNLRHEEIWFNLAASALTTRSAEAAHQSWSETLHALELPESLLTHVGLWRLPPLLVAQRLRLAVMWGEDLEVARQDRATLSSLGLLDLGELDSAGFGWRVSVPAQLAVIRFDIADRKAEAALARAVVLRPILEARRYVRRLIELNLLQGRASIAIGDQTAGYALVRAALRLSVDSGMVQCFISEVRFLGSIISDLLLADDTAAEDRAFLEQLTVKAGRPSAQTTRFVANGQTFDLSNREAQLLRALTTGKTFKEISFALNISINTTKMHRARLYRKLGCNSRSHAIALAQELITN